MNTPVDFEQARFNMVQQQIRPWEVLDQDVLDLLSQLRREDFVPGPYRALALADLEIPLLRGAGPSARMWAPRIEARVLQEIGTRRTDRVLEIGAGSGYLAALLANRARDVVSVEINAELVEMATRNLARAGIDNVAVEQGDGASGWKRHAPYDVIVITASTPLLPEAFLAQLRPGGRLFAIVGDPPVMAARLVSRDAADGFVVRDLFETCFPPLINALQPDRFQF